jgi:multidrug efflux pump subunit AcrA (membrane-fusion protein)
LKKREIRSPISGVILERHVDAGEFVSEGEKLVTIVDLDRLRIEAEVDEYDAPRLAVGAGVKIMAEGHAGESWRGRVEEIPDAVVPRRIRPEDPGRPIDARVLAVKVAFEGEVPLPLGRRVEITIEVLGDPGSRGDSGSVGDSLPKERGKSSLKGE